MHWKASCVELGHNREAPGPCQSAPPGGVSWGTMTMALRTVPGGPWPTSAVLCNMPGPHESDPGPSLVFGSSEADLLIL